MWFIKAKANLHQAYVTLTELGYEVLIYLVQWLQMYFIVLYLTK